MRQSNHRVVLKSSISPRLDRKRREGAKETNIVKRALGQVYRRQATVGFYIHAMYQHSRNGAFFPCAHLAYVGRMDFTRMVFVSLRLLHPLLQSFYGPLEHVYLGLGLIVNRSISSMVLCEHSVGGGDSF